MCVSFGLPLRAQALQVPGKGGGAWGEGDGLAHIAQGQGDHCTGTG